jgi:hypothetical protein
VSNLERKNERKKVFNILFYFKNKTFNNKEVEGGKKQ